MLADKTLLSVTLAATFASGTIAGYSTARARDQIVGPTVDPMVVYAGRQLERLKVDGYDEAEIKDARQVYADWWNGYDYWLREFQDVHRSNLDLLDEKRDKRLEALDASHAARKGGK